MALSPNHPCQEMVNKCRRAADPGGPIVACPGACASQSDLDEIMTGCPSSSGCSFVLLEYFTENNETFIVSQKQSYFPVRGKNKKKNLRILVGSRERVKRRVCWGGGLLGWRPLLREPWARVCFLGLWEGCLAPCFKPGWCHN